MRKPLRHDGSELLLLLRHDRYRTPVPTFELCDKFIYTENLAFDVPDEDADDSGESADEAHGGGEASGAHVANGSAAARAGTGTGTGTGTEKWTSRASAAQLKSDTKLVTLLRNATEAASDDDGWAMLSAVGEIITKQRPDFDSRSYGYAKLSDLIDATTLFETERRSPGDGKQAVIYLRDKRRRSAAKKARVKLAL